MMGQFHPAQPKVSGRSSLPNFSLLLESAPSSPFSPIILDPAMLMRRLDAEGSICFARVLPTGAGLYG
jgi:hypothetical protein